MSSFEPIYQKPIWKALEEHAQNEISKTHLRELVSDPQRCASCFVEYDNIYMDFSRQRVTSKTLSLLFDLAEGADLFGKIKQLASGAHVNSTENRAVMHIALRAAANQKYEVDGVNVVPAVHEVLQKIASFSEKIRSGAWRGVSGKPLKNVVAIGIGGSYLGANFVHEALQQDMEASKAAQGRTLRFLANVDPVAVTRALEGLNPEETLVVIISKTFTTKETMVNAKSVRQWIVSSLSALGHAEADIIRTQMVAVSTNIKELTKFGIAEENAFAFWDWVGGRFSVCSAVGILPLSLQYGFPVVEKFLAGARSIDNHFLHAPARQNLPVLLGLLGIWNASFLGFRSRALIPYSEALHKFAAHIQQVDMESNGKRVHIDGSKIQQTEGGYGPLLSGEVNFGEPGTNSQHSFFQLIHQGQVIPVDFIGFAESQTPISVPSEDVANHDELMCNFFAQPDALAFGKTEEELKQEDAEKKTSTPAHLLPHKVFDGNRPSTLLLLPRLTAYECGQLLALYEHRTAVQGFIWGINSFDQFGVELGKVLANKVRSQMKKAREQQQQGQPISITNFNPATTTLLQKYLQHKTQQSKL